MDATRRRATRVLVPLGLLAFFAVAMQVVLGSTGGDGGGFPTPDHVPDPASVYDPVQAGEQLPSGFRQLLRRDAILPVYEPVFVPATAAGWPDDALVIGLEIDGESRAYPVSFLNRREMVIDRVAGIPVLVTW
jgi:hypothetical protein